MPVKATVRGNAARPLTPGENMLQNNRTPLAAVSNARPKSTPTQMYKQKMAELHEKLDQTEQGLAEGTVDLEDFDSTDDS